MYKARADEMLALATKVLIDNDALAFVQKMLLGCASLLNREIHHVFKKQILFSLIGTMQEEDASDCCIATHLPALHARAILSHLHLPYNLGKFEHKRHCSECTQYIAFNARAHTCIVVFKHVWRLLSP